MPLIARFYGILNNVEQSGVPAVTRFGMNGHGTVSQNEIGRTVSRLPIKGRFYEWGGYTRLGKDVTFDQIDWTGLIILW